MSLPHDWAVWAAGNLIRGLEPERIVADLVQEGFAPDTAAADVAALADSAGVVAARLALRPVQLAHQLRREHLRLGPPEVAVRAGLSADRLYADHVAPQLPVVLPDLMDGWPARAWTWDALVARFGDVEIDVCEGRTGVPEPSRRWRSLVARRRLADVVARVLDPTTADDVYVTANNAALTGPLAGLLADVRPVDGILLPDRLAESSVWIGGAGTHTPVHHDVSDTLLCQAIGAKQVLLAPAEEIELADHGAGFHGPDVDLADPRDLTAIGLSGMAVRRAVIEAGQALLIPAGWWHQVRALTPSVSISLVGMRHRNDYRWYRPCPPDPLALDGA